MPIITKLNKLSPLLKYPGGKDKELRYILPNIPQGCNQYFEPFVGGGAVYFALDCPHYYINDLSGELIQLYQMVETQDQAFLDGIRAIDENWNRITAMVEAHRSTLKNLYRGYRARQTDTETLRRRIQALPRRLQPELGQLLQAGPIRDPRHFMQEFEDSLANKIVRMANLEEEKGLLSAEDVIDNLEGAIKSAFYTHLRYLYNERVNHGIALPESTALFFFMREFCYSSMFRYNRDGGFNVPYGGISYNRKNLGRKLQYFSDAELLNHLRRTTYGQQDFETFLQTYVPGGNDFVFLDPPYDTAFSTYSRNAFGQADQRRLANYLITVCRARFMLVIKNTDFILSLYPEGAPTAGGGAVCVNRFDKKYFVSFQDRNDKQAQHLLITNYPVAVEV